MTISSVVSGTEEGRRQEQKSTAPCPCAGLSPVLDSASSEMSLGRPRSQRGREMRVILAEKEARPWALFWILFLISRGTILGVCPVTLPTAVCVHCILRSQGPCSLCSPPTSSLGTKTRQTRTQLNPHRFS